MGNSVEDTWVALDDPAAPQLVEADAAQHARAVAQHHRVVALADADVLPRQPRPHHQLVAAPTDLAALHHLSRLHPCRVTYRRQPHRPGPFALIPARRRPGPGHVPSPRPPV